jgi:hypothetical protein
MTKGRKAEANVIIIGQTNLVELLREKSSLKSSIGMSEILTWNLNVYEGVDWTQLAQDTFQ